MLVALLSSLEPAGDGATCPRAFLKVTGRAVIERQVELALALGCERIICFGTGIAPELLAAQHRTERDGKRFHLLRSIDTLRAQVTAADELLVIADGVLPDPDLLADALGSQRGVAVFPAQPGLAAGFERLDRDWAWAGVLRCSGAELERMADLPPDIDPLAALMRAALQAGCTLRPQSSDILAEERWPQINSAEQARRVSQRVVARRSAPEAWTAPGHALIDRLVRANADRLLRGESTASIFLGFVLIAGLSGVAAAAAGFLVSAFGLIGLSAAALRARSGLAALRDAPRFGHVRSAPHLAEAWGIDLLMFGAVAAHVGAAGWSTAGYPLVVMLGLLHLLTVVGPLSLRPLGGDRIVLAFLLAGAAWQSILGSALQVVSLMALGACLFAQRPARLTRA